MIISKQKNERIDLKKKGIYTECKVSFTENS